MFVLLRLIPIDEEIAKVLISQHATKRYHRLAENLFSMSDKQQSRFAPQFSRDTSVIKRSNHRFAGSRGSNDQMPIFVLDIAFRSDDVKDLFLKRERTQVEVDCQSSVRSSFPLGANCLAKPRQRLNIERLELVILPIGFKCARDLVPQIRQLVLTDLRRPFKSLGQRRVRQIGGANIGTAEAGLAVEQIGFRVQPGSFCVVADSHLRPWKLTQCCNRFRIRCTHVAGGDNTDSQFVITFDKFAKVVNDDSQSAPFDERAENVNSIASCDFLAKLASQTRV